MATFNIQSVIAILTDLANRTQFDIEKIDEAIDALEDIKSTIHADDDESLDKVDEIQDYLQYLLVDKNPLMEEIKEELLNVIDDLQQWSK